MATLDYGAVARKYAEQVQAGEILACRWAKAAAKRQLNDLSFESDHWTGWANRKH